MPEYRFSVPDDCLGFCFSVHSDNEVEALRLANALYNELDHQEVDYVPDDAEAVVHFLHPVQDVLGAVHIQDVISEEE